MSEVHGLRAVVASAGTVHGIAEPPERQNFATYNDFAMAYSRWWVRTHCWKSSIFDPKSPEDAEPGEWELS